MIRKPKTHPRYKTNLVGINFRERWNVVEYATKSEIETYISNYIHINTEKRNLDRHWWDRREAMINESTQNNYLRKLWRKRHSESFQKDVPYRVDKNIARWCVKLGPKLGDGIGSAWQFDRNRTQSLRKGDILMLTRVDEMGNLYFVKANDIDAKHPYVFNRDNAQLSYVVPLDS
jgi:hypothetical protein